MAMVNFPSREIDELAGVTVSEGAVFTSETILVKFTVLD